MRPVPANGRIIPERVGLFSSLSLTDNWSHSLSSSVWEFPDSPPENLFDDCDRGLVSLPDLPRSLGTVGGCVLEDASMGDGGLSSSAVSVSRSIAISSGSGLGVLATEFAPDLVLTIFWPFWSESGGGGVLEGRWFWKNLG